MGILLLISEIWKQYVLHFHLFPGSGAALWYFPMQLCSLPMYLCLLGYRFPKAVPTYLATYGLLSGIMVFFDVSGFYDFGYMPLTVHSYLWHGTLIALGLISAGYLKTRENLSSDFCGATLIFLCGLLTAQLLNRLLSRYGTINMFYVNPDLPMQQAYFSDIAEYLGGIPEKKGIFRCFNGNDLSILVYLLSIVSGAMFLNILLLAASPGGPAETSGESERRQC